MNIENEFPNGILSADLYIGLVSSVSANVVRVNINEAGSPSGTHYSGNRYGKGEVGEFVLIEGQLSLLLGRVVDVRLPESERKMVTPIHDKFLKLDAIGNIQLLGTVAMDTLQVSAGVDSYPRLGDRVYAAPLKFISKIPSLMNQKENEGNSLTLKLGTVDISTNAQAGLVEIKPETLFGRHCAILGATGGGKSWTTARIIEECIKHKSKILLLDATGEYRDFGGQFIENYHLCASGVTIKIATGSISSSLPANIFTESDFVALFKPSPGIQAPKFREALVSLRMVYKKPSIGVDGYLLKSNRTYQEILSLSSDPDVVAAAHNPNSPFDISKLIGQLEKECVWENDSAYGRKNDQHWGFCSTLVSRIASIVNSKNLSFVFNPGSQPSITEKIKNFLKPDNSNRLLRICLSGVSYEFQTREIVANTIGRFILGIARSGLEYPVVMFVDEAHNFIGRQLGSDETSIRLDSFEMIAKEGRKYGLNICLSTQRPRDITESVLSQMGTLIVHRLTNDRDREVVERACGEIDRSASAFLPNLKQGEVIILGTDFPIPITIKISEPSIKPLSDGPNYQKSWV